MSALAIPFALALLAPAARAGEEDVRLLLPDAKETKRLDAALPQADLAAIARALGRDAASPGPAIEVYRAKASLEGEPAELRVAVVPAKGPRGGIRIALALDGRGDVRALKVLGEAGGAGSEEFLAQFIGSWAEVRLTPASWNPPSTLEEKRKGAAGTGEEAKRLRIFFALNDLMFVNQGAAGAISLAIDHRELARAAPPARQLAANLAKVVALSSDLPPVLEGKDIEGFRKLADGAKRTAEDLSAAVEKGETEKARDIFSGPLQQACGRCHGWDDHRYRKPLTRAFEKMREEAGIGPGFFVVGHDVYAAPGEEPGTSQAVASAVKEGLLFLRKLP